MLKAALAALGIFLSSHAHAAAIAGVGDIAGLHPNWDWKTFETDHFRVTYPAELEPVARKAAGHLEEAHGLLTQFLRWKPRLRTQVVVVDNQDSANGFAAANLRIGMVLLATPPDNWSSLYHYDDWLRLLCIHEYTHFVNIDTTTHWLYQGLRFLVGDTLLPNSLWPIWMLEGLAVFTETRFTKAGRGRSPFYEMVLRSAVEEKKLDTSQFVTLDKVAGDNPYYPAGEIPYLFGYQLMNEVAKDTEIRTRGKTADLEEPLKDGQDALGLMSYRSGKRVPFLINSNLENIAYKNWYEYWDSWVAETTSRGEASLAKIRSQPVTGLKRLTEKGFEVLGLAVSPDGKWLAYTQDGLDRRSSLYLRDLKSGKTRLLNDEKLLGVGHAFTPDSRTLLFSSLRRTSPFYLHSDLAEYDLERDSWHWLSQGLRARDPDVSHDGTLVAFTLSESAVTGLAVAPLEKHGSRHRLGTVRKLFMPPQMDRVSNPKFSPDGRHVVFTWHKNGVSAEDLASVDVETGKVTTLLSDGHYNRFPAYDPKGHLHFVSDASGVDNIYALRAPGQAELRTNVTTGLWLPAFAPEGTLYASSFSTGGFDLSLIHI